MALTPNITRRGLLVGGAVGGGLLVAWALTPRRFPLELPLKEGEFAFGAWLTVARTGIVSVAVPQLEMGQGVSTLIPQLVATELGADWRKVAAVPAPVSGAWANVPLAAEWAPLWMPFAPGLAEGEDGRLARSFAERHRFMATAAGTSLAAYEAPARHAAAAARELLCRAAASRWDADWRECKAANGFVTHGTSRASFADLAEDAAAHDLPAEPQLGPAPSEPPPAAAAPRQVRHPRLDTPALVEGAARFAGDVRLEGMAHAAIRHAPLGTQASLGAVPETAPGGVQLVKGPDWLAAVAPTWWAAEQALARVAPSFKVSHPIDGQAVEAALDKAVRKARTERIATVGDPEGAMGEGAPSLVARYDIAPALHAPLETASCTARLVDGRLELWLASQAPETSRRAVATALGLNPRDVVLYPMPAGGSFDARLDTPHAVEAALIARAAGKPVQLSWSRWQEQLGGKPRPPASAILWARTRPDGGEVLAWHTRVATPAAAAEFGRRLFGEESPREALAASAGEADPMAVAGAVPPYALAAFALDHVPVMTGIPAGRMRGSAHAMTAFFTESFVDELARAAGREPLSYRIEMLGNDVRLGECLQRCASLAGWDAGADASGQGLACHRMGEGRIAVIATARQDVAGVRVDKITAVADIGRVVNQDIARQQIEGGLIFGLGLTLGASTTFARGLPVAERLSQLSLPLLGNTPEIAVELVESSENPVDPGEIGVVAVAPAIANALHSATGVRFRKLPLFAEEV